MNKMRLNDILGALESLEEYLPDIKEVLSEDKTENLEERISDLEEELEVKEERISDLEEKNKALKEFYKELGTIFPDLELSLEYLTRFLNEFLKVSNLKTSWKFEDRLFQVNKDFNDLLEVFNNLEILE